MSVEDNLKDLILERYGSMIEFSKKIGMANSTVATILNRGVHKASIANVIKICEELDISADALANDKIIPNSKKQDFLQSPTELDEIISIAKLNIIAYDITIDGEKVDKDIKEMLVDVLELSSEFIKKQHNRKKDTQ